MIRSHLGNLGKYEMHSKEQEVILGSRGLSG